MTSRLKTLVILRHAHRDTADRAKDNGLSSKGRKQAKRIRRYFKSKFPDRRALLLSSPKKRCLETLKPIARWGHWKIRADARLMEKGPEESPVDFRRRVQGFLDWWRSRGPALAVACSHGDWAPEFLKTATRADAALKKGGWAALELNEGKVYLVELIQNFSFLK